jgi:hypothetical protein
MLATRVDLNYSSILYIANGFFSRKHGFGVQIDSKRNCSMEQINEILDEGNARSLPFALEVTYR